MQVPRRTPRSLSLGSVGVMNAPAVFLAFVVFPFLAVADEFQIIKDSISPNHRYALAVQPSITERGRDRVMFFDISRSRPISDDLSEDSVFELIALAHRNKPSGAGSPTCKIVWTTTSRRVAFYAGFHQFASVTAFDVLDGRPKPLGIPDMRPERAEIQRRIEPFHITKDWQCDPSWPDPNRLCITLSGSAYKSGGRRESDFLDYAFRATIRFDAKGIGYVIALDPTR
jgi:hypothetical protein